MGRILIALIMLISLSGCHSKLKESVDNLKKGDRLLDVYNNLGKPTEFYYKKEDTHKMAFLYRNGSLNCAIEFERGSLTSRTCTEWK
jgi:hypothetical protein